MHRPGPIRDDDKWWYGILADIMFAAVWFGFILLLLWGTGKI